MDEMKMEAAEEIPDVTAWLEEEPEFELEIE